MRATLFGDLPGSQTRPILEVLMLGRMTTAALICSLLVGVAHAEPLFRNSVVSNDIDFLEASDPAVPGCLDFLGQETREMPGALDSDELFASDVYIFRAAFADASTVGVWVHPSAGTREDAERLAGLLTGPIGRLPAVMRARLDRVIVHSGDHAAFGEHLGHFFVVFEDNIHKRLSTHDLEETVFHESVHATLDAEWAESAEWQQAQASDGAFITEYAAEEPRGEDLAESALFALTYLRHPDRLPPAVREGIQEIMPARLAFFEAVFSDPEPDATSLQLPDHCVAQ